MKSFFLSDLHHGSLLSGDTPYVCIRASRVFFKYWYFTIIWSIHVDVAALHSWLVMIHYCIRPTVGFRGQLYFFRRLTTLQSTVKIFTRARRWVNARISPTDMVKKFSACGIMYAYRDYLGVSCAGMGWSEYPLSPIKFSIARGRGRDLSCPFRVLVF